MIFNFKFLNSLNTKKDVIMPANKSDNETAQAMPSKGFVEILINVNNNGNVIYIGISKISCLVNSKIADLIGFPTL